MSRIMNTKNTNQVTIVKWHVIESGAFVTGIYGVYADPYKAAREMMAARDILMQKGYIITKRDHNEVMMEKTEDNRTTLLYLETYKIQ